MEWNEKGQSTGLLQYYRSLNVHSCSAHLLKEKVDRPHQGLRSTFASYKSQPLFMRLLWDEGRSWRCDLLYIIHIQYHTYF